MESNEKRRGRPCKDVTKPFRADIRMTKEQRDMLNDICAWKGLTATDVLLAGIEMQYDKCMEESLEDNSLYDYENWEEDDEDYM